MRRVVSQLWLGLVGASVAVAGLSSCAHPFNKHVTEIPQQRYGKLAPGISDEFELDNVPWAETFYSDPGFKGHKYKSARFSFSRVQPGKLCFEAILDINDPAKKAAELEFLTRGCGFAVQVGSSVAEVAQGEAWPTPMPHTVTEFPASHRERMVAAPHGAKTPTAEICVEGPPLPASGVVVLSVMPIGEADQAFAMVWNFKGEKKSQ